MRSSLELKLKFHDSKEKVRKKYEKYFLFLVTSLLKPV